MNEIKPKPLWVEASPCLFARAGLPVGGLSSLHQRGASFFRGPPRLPVTTGLCFATFPVTFLWTRPYQTRTKGRVISKWSCNVSHTSLCLPGSQRVLLRVNPQLHFLHRLPQEEELFDLALVLAVETQEVLLRHLLGWNGPVSEATGLWIVGLEELVEIALDPELVLQSLDGALKMLGGAEKNKVSNY